MKNYVYALFNNLSKRYESVMSFPSDSMAIHRLDKNVDHVEFTLCRVGSIDIESGEMECITPVHLIWETNENLPKTEAE